MLERLEVQNLAVLESIALEFGPGLTVLTGETGAGKSVLVDALSLLQGEGASGLLRTGAEYLLVTAWFSGRVLSRRVGQGRSTPRIGGEVVSMRELAEEASRHLVIHAQHAVLTLSSARSQLAVLDAIVDPALISSYKQAFARFQGLKSEEERLRRLANERGQKLDLLRFQIGEIQQAAIGAGEKEALEQEAERLGHLEVIRDRVNAALTTLSTDGDALGLTALAHRELKAAGRFDSLLQKLAQELETTESALRAVVRELEDYLEGLEADPARLEELHSRLALIQRLERKYGEVEGGLAAFYHKASQELVELEGAEDRLEKISRELAEAEGVLLSSGKALSQARASAARSLEQATTKEIRALGMPEARFRVALTPLPGPASDGLEEVQLLFSSNPSLALAPLEKAASGGELSRVMLALALLTGAEATTVVFDEIDSGVGGEAAWSVAERLAMLAERRQVLVVTHLAQIAARADRHYRVTKQDGAVVIQPVEGQERVRELARMLSGSYSEAALQHARELIADKTTG